MNSVHTLSLPLSRGVAIGLGFLFLSGCQLFPPGGGGDEKWISLFDGKTLKGWNKTAFGGEGEIMIENGAIVMEYGSPMTGINWKADPYDLPRINYEIQLEGNRMDGNDFFCGLTFPVKKDPCSLILGGWGGTVCGLSSLDGMDAANNETAMNYDFKEDKWYKIRLRVTETNISAWVDGEEIVNADIKGRKIGVRPEVEPSEPLGIANFDTIAGIRNIRIRPLTPDEIAGK